MLRDALFYSEEPGFTDSIILRQGFQYITFRCRYYNIDHDEDVAVEVRSFSCIKWLDRDIHDTLPFRLTGGQFGVLEEDMDISQY